MTRNVLLILGLLAPVLAGSAACESGGPKRAQRATKTNETLVREVREAETAFAKTMALRDRNSFASHVSDEALFFGSQGVLRGKSAVVAGWERFFAGPDAPFSWEPEQVEVLDSGSLALSTGPVRDPDGKRIGTFNSIWRRETEGVWKVIFDKGCPPCDCPPGSSGQKK